MPSKEMILISGKDVNSAWRLSLPKDGCRVLGWAPGDTITVSVVGKTMKLVKVV